jgi:tripartite-type tricarboxylate transporter receptor subunit TctC
MAAVECRLIVLSCDAGRHGDMPMTSYRSGTMLAAALMFGALPFAALAQDAYPSRPIQMIVTTAAGGTGDLVARVVGDRLSEALKQPIVVENQPAGNGSVAVGQVARAKPDGHTLIFMADSTLTINPHLYTHLTVDPVKELAPVGIAAKMPMVLLAGQHVKAANVQELIALARANPGKLSYASTGVGTHLHIGGEMFKLKTKTDIVHVPYRGNTGAITDLLGGRIDMILIGQPALAGQVAGDKVKVMGLAAEQRSALLPQVPTLTEAGLPDYFVSAWYGLLAPAATPKPILDRLATEMQRLRTDEKFRQAIAKQGLEVIASSPQEMAVSVKTESDKWGEVIRVTGTTISPK